MYDPSDFFEIYGFSKTHVVERRLAAYAARDSLFDIHCIGDMPFFQRSKCINLGRTFNMTQIASNYQTFDLSGSLNQNYFS